ncbi:MAG: TIM barrel protein [Candidatus Thermoplasmatota archaeon]|nr:TIM barrel protein [Candidatus Thermoplasmatota archaeon]
MIRFGPSGIPLSCKGRTLEDGIEDVHKLGLNAFEVQFLRPKVRTRPVEDEEIGLKAKNVPEKFIIGVNRGRDYKEIFVEDLEKELKRGDMIHSITGGVAEDFYKFQRLSRLSKELDVKMSLHTPYYIKLTETGTEAVEKSRRHFKYGAIMADILDAGTIVTHLGVKEEGKDKDDIEQAVVENLRELRDWITEKCEKDIKIGIETQTGEDVYGNLDEILEICRQVSETVPVINFAHIKAEGNYSLKDEEDFAEIFHKCENFVKDEYYVNFSGVEKRRTGECRMTPIKRGDLNFEDLVDYLIKTEDNITIISTSPLKEHDAMYMKVIFERIYSREIGKELRRENKDE